jgi:hypothetical protein
MANEQHVALLRSGAAAWNAWRDINLAQEGRSPVLLSSALDEPPPLA